VSQIDSLFGPKHDEFLARLRKATKKRAKRALVAKAMKGVTALVKIKGREITLLLELRERLRDYEEALKDGSDGKLAKHILGRHDG
jgi:hypothetical protein